LPTETIEFSLQTAIWLFLGMLFFANIANMSLGVTQFDTVLQADHLINYLAVNVNLVGSTDVQTCVTLPNEVNGLQYSILVSDDLITINIANQSLVYKTKYLITSAVLYPGKTYRLIMASSTVIFNEA